MKNLLLELTDMLPSMEGTIRHIMELHLFILIHRGQRHLYLTLIKAEPSKTTTIRATTGISSSIMIIASIMIEHWEKKKELLQLEVAEEEKERRKYKLTICSDFLLISRRKLMLNKI